MVATEELRRIANANTELRKKVDGLNARPGSSSGPESGKCGATNHPFDKDESSFASRAGTTSIDAGGGRYSKPKADKWNSRSGSPSSLSRPRSQTSAVDEFSSLGIDGIAAHSNPRNNGASHQENTHHSRMQSTSENAHPNLMDY